MAPTGTQQPEDTFTISCRRLEDVDDPILRGRQATGRGIVIALRGELDLATAQVAEDELRRAEASEDRIVVDLREVSFMDSTGLRTMIEAERRLRARGGSLVIVQGSPQVRRLFELSGVAGHLEVVDEADPGSQT